MIEYTCESCGNTNYAPDGAQGRFVKCLRCLELCRVPRADVPAEDLEEAVEKAYESIQPQAEATTNSVEPAGIAEDQPGPQLDPSQSPEATSLSASASGLSLDEVMASGDSLNGGEDSCAWKPPPERLTESNPGRIANLDQPVERRSSPIVGSMKILTISPVYCHPTWFASRVARLTNETLMGLSSLGHKNTVFCPLFDHTEEMEFGEAMRDGDGKPNRKRHSVTFADGNLKVFYRDDVEVGPKGLDCGKSLPPEFVTHLEDARLLYLPGPVTPWMMRAAKFARSRGVPYVLEPFGSLPPEMFKRGLMSLLGGNHFESLFGRAAVVVLPDRERPTR